MPKRAATPPPADDEPRYLTVVHPFVPSGHCNMELPKDRQDFARWIACCIDKDAIYTFFHKPSARDMVIIEVKRDYPHFDRLLGEHRWSEFLRNPSDELKNQATRVYYCTYSTGRIVQKNGWKRVEIKDEWFKSWSPNNRIMTYPYPPTHFCDVPVEDQTNHPLCRPLPGAVKAPPPEVLVAPAPVVGSGEWVAAQKTAPSKVAGGAWAKGAPKVSIASSNPGARSAPVSGDAWKTSAKQGPPNTKRMPAVGGGPIAVKASNISRHLSPTPPAPVTNGWDDTPISSTSNTSEASTPSPLPSSPPSAPPGLPAPGSAWATAPIAPPGLPPPKAWNLPNQPTLPPHVDSAASWESSATSASGSASDDPYRVHVQIPESMEDALHKIALRGREDEDDAGLDGLDVIVPGTWDTAGLIDQDGTSDAGQYGAWDDPDTDAETQSKKGATAVVLCNAHGLICKKGICLEYAMQLRDIKRAEQAAERGAARGGRGRGRGRGDRGGRGRGLERGRGGGVGVAFRGRGTAVKTNWRGVPREIVTAASIEQREASRDGGSTTDGWGKPADDWNRPVEGEAEAAADNSWVSGAKDDTQNSTPPKQPALPANTKAPSASGWSVSDVSNDPWGTNTKAKVNAAPATTRTTGPPRNGWNAVPQANRNARGHPTKKAVNVFVPANTHKAASNDGWNLSEASHDPWGSGPAVLKKKAKATNLDKSAKGSWADQMDAESAAGHADDDDGFSVVGSKRGGRAASVAASSRSGWGTVSETPW